MIWGGVNGPQIKLGSGMKSEQVIKLAIAAVAILIGAWMLWSGIGLISNSANQSAAESSRAQAAVAIGQYIDAARQQLDKRRADKAVIGAINDGNLEQAQTNLAQGWNEAEAVELHDLDLQKAFADPAKFGYGKLGVLQQALLSNQIVGAFVADGGGAKLALAAPVIADGKVFSIAYARFSLQPIEQALKAQQKSGVYLALRQQTRSLIEVGDTALSGQAELGAVQITDLPARIVGTSAIPESGLLDLGGYAELGAGALLVLFGLALGLLPGKVHSAAVAKITRSKLDTQAEAQMPTLAELKRDGLVQPAPVEAPKAAIKINKPPPPPPIKVDPGIFRAYDIRGIFGKSLDVGVARAIGQAIGTIMHEQGLRSIVVGRDGRLSSPELAAGLIEGLRNAGREVIDIGLAPTPVVYFGAHHLHTGSGVVVTGSHNPPDYNGFKIVIDGTTLSGAAITDLYTRISQAKLHQAQSPGSLDHRDISDDYIQRITSDLQIERRMRVVVDAGSGVAGAIAPALLEAIGAQVDAIFCEVDGSFPHHHPDPSDPRNLTDLIDAVKRLDAEIGIAFDGDGDRLGVVTRDGEMIFPDRLLMLFASDVLERNPGACIIYDVKCTGHLAGHILRHGGSPLMWKTGHSLIKAKMKETEAELAGEMSGHFFFRERWYGFDDGLYAACRLLEILASRSQTPKEVFAELPKGVSTPELHIKMEEGQPHRFIDSFVGLANFSDARLSTIDGLRADWPDGWGLVRASNTTPVLVLRFDADNEAAIRRIQDAFRTQMLAIDASLKLPF